MKQHWTSQIHCFMIITSAAPHFTRYWSALFPIFFFTVNGSKYSTVKCTHYTSLLNSTVLTITCKYCTWHWQTLHSNVTLQLFMVVSDPLDKNTIHWRSADLYEGYRKIQRITEKNWKIQSIYRIFQTIYSIFQSFLEISGNIDVGLNKKQWPCQHNFVAFAFSLTLWITNWFIRVTGSLRKFLNNDYFIMLPF